MSHTRKSRIGRHLCCSDMTDDKKVACCAEKTFAAAAVAFKASPHDIFVANKQNDLQSFGI